MLAMLCMMMQPVMAESHADQASLLFSFFGATLLYLGCVILFIVSFDACFPNMVQ